jgi:hypothetical protein
MALSLPVAVDKINGRPIRSLADVVEAFGSNHERFHRLEFERDGGIEALERERAEAAHPEILKQYAIPHDRKL